MACRWFLERMVHTDTIELSSEEGVYTVGRGKENFIKCLSLYVSRRHCKILQRDGRLTIIDLKSANGTFVNQIRILAEREIPLQEGDLIGMGVCETTDIDCYVYRLYQKAVAVQIIPNILPLPDSSTTEHEFDIITVSDSENGTAESREAQAKEVCRKRHMEQEDSLKHKIPRLENSIKDGSLPCSFMKESISLDTTTRNVSEVSATKESEVPHSKQNLKSCNDLIKDNSEVRTSNNSGENNKNTSCELKSAVHTNVDSKQVQYPMPSDFSISNNIQNKLEDRVNSSPRSLELGNRKQTIPSSDVSFGRTMPSESHESITLQTNADDLQKFHPVQNTTVYNISPLVSINEGHKHSNESSVVAPVLESIDLLPTSKTEMEAVEMKADFLKFKEPDAKARNVREITEVSQSGKVSEKSTSISVEPREHTVECNSKKLSSRVTNHMAVNNDDVTVIVCSDDEESDVDVRAVKQKTNSFNTTHVDKHEINVSDLNETVFKSSKLVSDTENSAVETSESIALSGWKCISVPEISGENEQISKDKENLDKELIKNETCPDTDADNGQLTRSKENNEKQTCIIVSSSSSSSSLASEDVFQEDEIKDSTSLLITDNKLKRSRKLSSSSHNSNNSDSMPVRNESTVKCSETLDVMPHSNKQITSRDSSLVKEVETIQTSERETSRQMCRSECEKDRKSINEENMHQAQSLAKLNPIISSHHLAQSDAEKSCSSSTSNRYVSTESLRETMKEMVKSDKESVRNRKSKISLFGTEVYADDKESEQISKCTNSLGTKLTKNETLAGTSMDNQSVTRNEKKTRRRIVSSSSSSSSSSSPLFEDVGLFQKTAALASNKLLKSRKLSSSSSDSNQSGHSSAASVNNKSIKSRKLSSSSGDSNCFDLESDRRNNSRSKNAVDSLKSVNVTAVDEEILVHMYKSKPVVQLERLDEKVLNLNSNYDTKVDTEMSDNDSLNYTLDEDIIVVDDDEEYFPSSQLFDEQKPSLSVTSKDDVEDSPFNREPEEDDETDEGSVFVDDDSDFEEDQWFKRLSQQEVESKPKLGQQELKKVQTETDLEEVPLQTKILPLTSYDDRRYELLMDDGIDNLQKKDELVRDCLLKSSTEVTKQKDPSIKPKSSGKLMIIEAPPMPPRRATQRGISAEEATRIYMEQKEQAKSKTVSSEKSKNIVSDSSVPTQKRPSKKDSNKSLPTQKLPSKKDSRTYSVPPEDTSTLSAREKKQIVDKRKEKLKEISEKEKALAEASRKQNSRVPAQVRIKVTTKNRGAFLIEGADDPATGLPAAIATSTCFGIKKSSHDEKETLVSTKKVKKQRTYDKSDFSLPENRSFAPSANTIKNLPRIPKLSERPSTSKSTDEVLPSEVNNLEDMSIPNTISVPSIPVDVNSLCPSIKSLVVTKSKGKKSVRFKCDSELVTVRIIPVAENSRLLPVNHKKDAPTPRKAPHKQQELQHLKGPNLEEVLYDILCWNPLWLEEQKEKTATNPPPVYGNKLWPMLSSFLSYKDYLKVLTPLLQLELWTRVTADRENKADERKTPLVVGIDRVNLDPNPQPNKKSLMYISCHAVLTEFESERQQHPRIGDLVFIELELEDEPAPDIQIEGSQAKRRRIVPIFSYVQCVNKEAVTSNTVVHKEILKHSNRPKTKISFLLWAKSRPYNVKTSHAMRIKVVSYIRHELRLFQAMAYLPLSPLCDCILKPEQQDYSLPNLGDELLVPQVKQDLLNSVQKRAILQTAHTCLKSEPKICMIQGPPGTGKSHVIVNLILQILYSHKQNRKFGSRKHSPRILLCAPSNAAVDELVLRLLQVRQKIRKEDRFKMVRSGRQETMNSAVKEISVIELAKRDARTMAQNLENVESVDLEIRNLEARRNSLGLALDTARQKKSDDSIREIEFKLGELERKLLQMKRCKTQNTTLNPWELRRLEADAQIRVLLGADIVATTLSSCFSNQMENIFTGQNKGREKPAHSFTCCIVDEATQSQELETLIPLMLGVTTLVLVGDAKQLPATVLSKMAKDNGLGKSLFARLQECFEDTVKNPVQFLGTQYRMHPEICMWPSRFFYSNRLHTAPNMSTERICPLVPYSILSLEYRQHNNGELSNAGEAELVSLLTIGILERIGTQFSIGIITPYHKQRTMIIKILQSSSHLSKNVEVNTIDSFQGQERDIIVMSCVRTGGIGFLADTQRLNVALTRARFSLLLCGNFTSLQNDSMWRALLDNANRRNMLKHVPSHMARNKDELLKLVLR